MDIVAYGRWRIKWIKEKENKEVWSGSDKWTDEWAQVEEIRTISEALKINSTLTSLNVKGIGKGGVMMIIEAMKINSTLTELDVSGEKM